MFDSGAEEALPDGDLDFTHYRALHRHFFQDVYEWAGETRTIRTGKGENWFCYPENEANRLFNDLAARDHLANTESKDAFAGDAGWLLAEINAIHRFREGNGRAVDGGEEPVRIHPSENAFETRVSLTKLLDGLTPVYIQIPFDMTKTFSGWLREVLKAGFDPMLAKSEFQKIRCSSCSTNS